MDAVILHERLAATEGALIKIDERLDAQGDTAAVIAAQSERIASLEENLSQCLERIETLLTTQQNQSAEAETARAEAEVARAEAEAAEAEAAALALALAAEAEAMEPEPEAGIVEEVEPEPESDGDGPASQQPPASSKWWENILALR